MAKNRRKREIDELEHDVDELRRLSMQDDRTVEELERLRREVAELKHEFYANLGPWQRTLLARHPQRPHTLDYVRMLFEGFQEIHGDRGFADDPAMVCGMARFRCKRVIV